MAYKASSSSSNEEVINHYGAIRLRMTGTGNLLPTLYSFDKVKVLPLVAMPMVLKTNIEPIRLSNLNEQKARLELRITELDETFKISKVVVFVKPVAKSYPSVS